MLLRIWSHAPMRALVRASSPLILVSGMLACGHDRVAAPPPPGRIDIASGVAVSGVHVSWLADDGGTIAPGESVSDVSGRATAAWTLGTSRDAHRGRAIATGYSLASFMATSPAEVELP